MVCTVTYNDIAHDLQLTCQFLGAVLSRCIHLTLKFNELLLKLLMGCVDIDVHVTGGSCGHSVDVMELACRKLN